MIGHETPTHGSPPPRAGEGWGGCDLKIEALPWLETLSAPDVLER